MGGRNSRFFHQLTPLAKALEKVREATPPQMSTCKDVPAIMSKRAAKMARRAKRAGHGVKA